MPRYTDIDKLSEHKFSYISFDRYVSDGKPKSEKEIYAYKVGYNDAIDRIVRFAPTADVVELKDLDKITATHEKIGYEKGYRDGYAQSVEDARELVGINTWAGARLTKLQTAQMGERRDDA